MPVPRVYLDRVFWSNIRGFGGRVIRADFGEDRVHVGRKEGGPVSGQEEFCKHFILHLVSLIEKIAKLMCTPSMREIFYFASFA